DLERWGIESVVRDFEKVFERGVKLYVKREESHRV
ncbi:hypothetical protein C5S29_08575, partial [ANME-1 cluster archaeon GoMg3.2]|nr:hypothetical protein [ANME-1 cluster archaeon GoMg3.2]